MRKEIAIVSVATTEMTVIEPNKEPNLIQFQGTALTFSRNRINIPLRDELTRLYNEGFSIETSNALTGVETYILVREI